MVPYFFFFLELLYAEETDLCAPSEERYRPVSWGFVTSTGLGG